MRTMFSHSELEQYHVFQNALDEEPKFVVQPRSKMIDLLLLFRLGHGKHMAGVSSLKKGHSDCTKGACFHFHIHVPSL
jgi:hypothetical protein